MRAPFVRTPFVRGLSESRPGFTLIELLVALSILLILATITIRLVNTTLDSDRLKAGSRELQSYLAGARDRAIYAGQPRGVRFIPDATDPYNVRSFVYIGASTNYTDGGLLDISSTGAVNFESTGTTLPAWQNLWNRGLLTSGAQIQLSQGPNVILAFLTVAPNPAPTGTTGPPTAFMITAIPGSGVFPLLAVSYQLHLAPAILTGEQPRSLPQNIVIDLRTSVLPTSWPAPTAASTYDVLFSPQGTVYGPLASSGRIHFVLADLSDTTGEMLINSLSTPSLVRFQLNAPWQVSTAYVVGNIIVPNPSSSVAYRCTTAGTSGTTPPTQFSNPAPNQTITDGGAIWQSFVKKANLIVSLATATGRVTTHPVDFSPNDTLAIGTVSGYDSFRYAEIGEVTQ
jgi:prepilin-type N-terminal cleavage/methylation domain-containing protein